VTLKRVHTSKNAKRAGRVIQILENLTTKSETFNSQYHQKKERKKKRKNQVLEHVCLKNKAFIFFLL
jgi:hypothetical protein